jgi:hypothetical protein
LPLRALAPLPSLIVSPTNSILSHFTLHVCRLMSSLVRTFRYLTPECADAAVKVCDSASVCIVTLHFIFPVRVINFMTLSCGIAVRGRYIWHSGRSVYAQLWSDAAPLGSYERGLHSESCARKSSFVHRGVQSNHGGSRRSDDQRR